MTKPESKWPQYVGMIITVLLATVAAFSAARIGLSDVQASNLVQDERIRRHEIGLDKYEANEVKRHDAIQAELKALNAVVNGLVVEIRILNSSMNVGGL